MYVCQKLLVQMSTNVKDDQPVSVSFHPVFSKFDCTHPGILEKFQVFKMASDKWQYCTNQYNLYKSVILCFIQMQLLSMHIR